MNTQQLRYVMEISQTHSITQAAKNLYMGQPNLSKSIKELEGEIGITLFRRTPKGVVATRQGEAFVGYARSIVAQMDSLAQLYQKDAPRGVSLRVSVPRASYVAHSFGAYVGSFGGRALDISYHETNAMSIISEIALGQSDMGVVRFGAEHRAYFMQLLRENALTAEPLWEYAMVVLLHERHPLAAMAEIPYHLLAQYPEIVHGDFTPVLPPEAVPAAAQHSAAQAAENRIAVFDRASQFTMLQSVKGSYLWVSPVPFAVLAQHELVQKPCHSATRYCDMLIRRTAEPFTAVEQGFADVLRQDIAALVHP
ncbi:MAG: LysR family transcriptional regulator [Ruthenibacterium sp.]